MTEQQIEQSVREQRLTLDTIKERMESIDFCWTDHPVSDPVKEKKRQHMMKVKKVYAKLLKGDK